MKCWYFFGIFLYTDPWRLGIAVLLLLWKKNQSFASFLTSSCTLEREETASRY